jgi:hypothetical protein
MRTRTITMQGIALLAVALGVTCLGSAALPHQVGGKAKMLWNQNNDFGGAAVNSQNYTSGNDAIYNDQGADDFVVPKGKTWSISEVDVSGAYYTGSGPAVGETVFIRKNNSGLPGKTLKAYAAVKGTENAGSFAIPLSPPAKLKAGTYWVTVQIDCAYDSCGEWTWSDRSVQNGYGAAWWNPGGGYGFCSTWDTLENCWKVGPDFMFALKGTQK